MTQGLFYPINRFRQALGTLVLQSLLLFFPNTEATGQGPGTAFAAVNLILEKYFFVPMFLSKVEN